MKREVTFGGREVNLNHVYDDVGVLDDLEDSLDVRSFGKRCHEGIALFMAMDYHECTSTEKLVYRLVLVKQHSRIKTEPTPSCLHVCAEGG